MLQILSNCYSTVTMLPRYNHVELDLGCGKGGFLLSLASKYPSRLVIGADVMLGRLRKVEKKANRLKLNNIQLLRVSAWHLIGYHLPDHSINRVHILCPDPWPKSRHRCKRLVTSEFLGRLSVKIVPAGILHLSTDSQEYYSFMLDAIAKLSYYEPACSGTEDINHLKTDFEMKFEKAKISVNHLVYRVKRSYSRGGGQFKL